MGGDALLLDVSGDGEAAEERRGAPFPDQPASLLAFVVLVLKLAADGQVLVIDSDLDVLFSKTRDISVH